MHDLELNFEKFHQITKEYLADYLIENKNFQYYRNPSKMPDSEIVALSICQEVFGIDSENFFHSKLKNDYHANFPNLSYNSI